MLMDRRSVVTAGAAMAAAEWLGLRLVTPAAAADSAPLAQRKIPSSGELVPVVGLGSWITFNVGDDPLLLDECAKVMAAFFAGGGRMIDSSPMYGSSQGTIGYGLKKLGYPEGLLSAEKVWTSYPSEAPGQIAETKSEWGVPRFDLLQVHNLLAWEENLTLLKEKKAAGEIRYIGVTTSHGRRHDLLERIMREVDLDFVQVTYNVLDREAESRLLPLARDRGIAVIVNRPYRRGELIRRFEGRPLPDFAAEIGASNWPQFLLKFVISHPAVTCAIPATSQVSHVRENLSVATGPMPDAAMRRRMTDYVDGL